MARSFIGRYDLPLGIRNNNPGNLMYNGDQWQGMTGIVTTSAGQYYQFENILWGIRAMATDLRSKINRGLNTITKIIEVYAPRTAHANATDAYILYVSSRTGINANSALQANASTLKLLVRAMINFENGTAGAIITDQEITEGISLMSGTVPDAVIWGGGLFSLAVLAFSAHLLHKHVLK